MEPGIPEWVTVYIAWGFSEANVVKGLLEANGIKCLLESNAAPSVHVFNIDGMGEVRLKVPAEAAEDAKQLIEHDASDLPDFEE